MENSFDVWAFVSGLPLPVLTVFATIGLLLLLSTIKRLTLQLQTITATIESIGKAVTTKDGDPVFNPKSLDDLKKELEIIHKDFLSHKQEAANHYQDVSRLAGEEMWKHCDVQRCSHLQGLGNKFERILERLDSFDRRAEESRSSTILTLQSLNQEQKDLGSELSRLAKSIIEVLSDIIKERDKK